MLLLVPTNWNNKKVSGASSQSNDELMDVIVQFEEAPIAQQEKLSKVTYNSKKDDSKKKHKKFLETLKAKGINPKVKNEYFFAYNGVALSVPQNKLKDIESIPGVKAVHPDAKVRAQLESSLDVIRAKEMWGKADSNNQSLTGKGMIVAVLDTGVDYTHPDLGRTYGDKVIGGYDYVNKDDDPMDDHGHGTHVAGIVAANGNLKGVAPDAKITAYKVLDWKGGGTTSDIVAAIDDSSDPENPLRADVINLSLGGPGDGTDPLSEAAQHAVDSGVIVVAAAGNSGPEPQTIGAPAAAEGVIAVGASISGIMAPKLSMVLPEKKEFDSYFIPFSANPPASPETLDLVSVGDGWEYNYEDLDVTGKTVIIPSYEEFADKNRAMFAKEKGAKAVILYMQEESSMSTSISKTGEAKTQNDGIYVVGVDSSTGQELLQRLTSGEVKISISGIDWTDRITSFSSRGASGYPRMKPDIVAPGALIKSTNLRQPWRPEDYVRMSGTSMASPHVAGAAALLKQSHPEWTVAEIRSALVGTAVPLDGYKPADQGAGRIDIIEADKAKVLAQPHAISFGIADMSVDVTTRTKELTLQNKSEQPVEVNLENIGQSNVVVEISESRVTIPANGTVTVDVTLKAAKTASSSDFTGWILVSYDSGEDIRVPYHFGVRYLEAFASPDPSTGDAGIYIKSPTPLKEAIVTITDSKGKELTTKAVHHHENWYEAKLTVKTDGIYKVSINATANEVSNFAKIFGETVFEVLPEDKNGKNGWKSVGPNTDGGEMIVDPKNKGTMYVLNGSLKGLFVTKDYGKSWEQFRDLPVAAGEPVELVINPKNSDQLFLAINGGSPDRTYAGKILMSNNRGKTWSTTNFPTHSQLKHLDISNDGKILIASTNYSIWVSKDQGQTWAEKASTPYIFTTAYHEGKLYAATGEGLFLIDNILNEPAEPKFLFNQVDNAVLKLIIHDGMIYANTSNSLYKSPLDGSKFTKIGGDEYGGIELLGILDDTIYYTNYQQYYKASLKDIKWQEFSNPAEGSVGSGVALWPDRDTLLVSAGSAGVYETSDGGKTYKRIGIPNAHVFDLDVTMDTNNKYKVYAGSVRGVYKTTFTSERDLSSEWGNSGSEGYFNESTYAVAKSPTESNTVYKVQQMYNSFGFFKSTDGGENWEYKYNHPDFGIGFFDLMIHPGDPNTIMMSFKKGNEDWNGYLVSHDGGETWEEVTVGKTIRAMEGDPKDPNKIWFATDQGLFVSNDQGKTMTQLQSMPITEVLYTGDKLIFGGERLYTSSDGGKSFKEGKYPIEIKVSDILQSPKDPNTLYAATTFNPKVEGLYRSGRGVLKSTDGGLTWTNFSYGLDNLDVFSLGITPDGKYLFAGTQFGGVHMIELKK